MAMMLVTGGAGFIGSHLVEALIARGDVVRVFDDFSTGNISNLISVDDQIEIHTGDLRDEVAVQRAVKNVDIVFHHAAAVSVPGSISDPQTTYAINVDGTSNLLKAMRRNDCRRIIFPSSSAVYGDDPIVPKRETMTPNPKSPYAVSKIMGERLCDDNGRRDGIETVILRYFNVYGPRQDPQSSYAAVIPRFLHTLQHHEAPVIYGDGEQVRDFINVADIVIANLLAAEAATEVVNGKIFNIASGVATSINQVLQYLSHYLNVEPAAHYEAARSGDVRISVADVETTRSELGFEARVSLMDGLADLVAATTNHCGDA